MKKSKKLIFFGTEQFSAASLQKLIDGGWDIAAVVTKPDHRSGRGLKLNEPIVKTIALKSGLEVVQPTSSTELDQKIKNLGAHAGVLVSYGKIIPQRTIDLLPGGIINVHPSLLPKYRGPSPIETAILNGDKETGVTLMGLVAKMDAGPIYAQQTVALTGKENRLSLSAKLADLGADMLNAHLGSILEGKTTPKPQNEADATYCKLISKADGIIDWSEPAEIIEREVRAYLGFPKTRTKLFDKYDVVITKTTVASAPNDEGLFIKTGSGDIKILELIAPSGRKVSGDEFLRGYPA
jgi:methionyl-tRNA formyltransferase